MSDIGLGLLSKIWQRAMLGKRTKKDLINKNNKAKRGPVLTSGRLLARNTVWNLLGQSVPMLVAVFSIPLLIRNIGTERFGILTLMWMVIGYFSLFDLGLGRALTQLVAEKLGAGEEQEIPVLVWTGLGLMLLLGLLGLLVMSILSPWLVHSILRIPSALQPEALNAFYLLAASIPVVISTAALAGILAAIQRFDVINAVRIPMGIFNFLGPVLVLPFSRSLFIITAVLVVGRLVVWAVYLLICFRVFPLMRTGPVFRRSVVKPLLSFGGWMTVTNVIGPLMVYLDRFLIGALASMAAVAYYATPYEVVTKLWIIPGALTAVLFPAFAASFVQDRNRTTQLFSRGVKYVFLAIFPVILLLVTLAYEGLDLWLGAEFARNSASVLQWLAAGVFINSLAHIPFALIQGAGRPDLTAKLHLFELPVYLGLLWQMLMHYGIEGAAVAWTARVALDAVLLFAIAMRFLPDSAGHFRRVGITVGAALTILAIAALLSGIVAKGLFLLLVLLAFAWAAWFLILEADERALVQNRLKIIRVFN